MMLLRRLRPAVLLALVAALAAACSGAPAEGAADPGVPAGTGSPAAASSPDPEASPPAASPAPSQAAAAPTATASPGAVQPSDGFSTAEIVLRDGQREVPMPVWVADTQPLRQRGLMGWTALPADAGMLFVFEQDTQGGFWMKDTLIPLSIAFVGADGRIVDILEMEPCTADPCPVYTPDASYRYAIEANPGFFEDHGVTAGWTVALDQVLGAR